MARKLDTGSKALAELRELLDRQKAATDAAVAREASAVKAAKDAIRAAEDARGHHDGRMSYEEFRAWRHAHPTPEWALEALASTQAECNLAGLETRSLVKAFGTTAVAYLTQLLADNAATLDGMNARYKRTLKLISDAMPEGFHVYCYQWSSMFPGAELVVNDDYDAFRGYTGLDAYIGKNYAVNANYEDYGSELISAATLHQPNFVREPGATPEQVRAQLDGLEAARDTMRAANKAHNAAVSAFREATSALVGLPDADNL